jgi:transcriptional regulator with XRE-family HTH domain
MLNTEWLERQNSSPEARREYEEERLVLAAAEAIAELMEMKDISKADLAAALGSSRAYVTGLLSGSRNMTLRTLASAVCVLGKRVELNLEPLGEGEFIPDWTKEFEPRPRSGPATEVAPQLAGVTEGLLAA